MMDEPEALVDALLAARSGAGFERSEVRVVRAPARVNLMGDHTDYNDGFALPAAINLALEIACVAASDRIVDLELAATGEHGIVDLDAIGPRQGTCLDYVAGTAWALAEAESSIAGFRGLLRSTIPTGAGLSSSAAIELAVAWALSGPDGPSLAPMTLVRTAQRAENAYVGVMSGVMDQFAVAMGRAGMALHLDCRTLAWRPVPIPTDLEIVVCHSGTPRRLQTSAYNDRRAECFRAAREIAAREPGVEALRDVDLGMLERHRARLDEVAYARALHIVTENDRVMATETALETGDLEGLRRIFAASHASLRDQFEVSSVALDTLVEIAMATPGVVAARLTGAGFGGCTVNLVERGRSDELRRALARSYEARTGFEASVYVVDAADGAGIAWPPP
ncbi:MAG: galactokinase [Chloroflexi bacterium]|nr:galactokinase [Chloroflexota bacterium]